MLLRASHRTRLPLYHVLHIPSPLPCTRYSLCQVQEHVNSIEDVLAAPAQGGCPMQARRMYDQHSLGMYDQYSLGLQRVVCICIKACMASEWHEELGMCVLF